MSARQRAKDELRREKERRKIEAHKRRMWDRQLEIEGLKTNVRRRLIGF